MEDPHEGKQEKRAPVQSRSVRSVLAIMERRFQQYLRRSEQNNKDRYYQRVNPPDYPATLAYQESSAKNQRKRRERLAEKFELRSDTGFDGGLEARVRWIGRDAIVGGKEPLARDQIFAKLREIAVEEAGRDKPVCVTSLWSQVTNRYCGIVQEDVSNFNSIFWEVNNNTFVREPDGTANSEWQQILYLKDLFIQYSSHLHAKKSKNATYNSTALQEGAKYGLDFLPLLTLERRVPTITTKAAKQISKARPENQPPFFMVAENDGWQERNRQLELNRPRDYLEKTGLDQTIPVIRLSNAGSGRWTGESVSSNTLWKAFNKRELRGGLSDTASQGFLGLLAPTNSLDIMYTGPPVRPQSFRGHRYEVLSEINNDLNLGDKGNSSGRPIKRTKASNHTDFMDGRKFALLTQRDAVTLAHCDRYALSTCVKAVHGEKLWIFVQFRSDESRDCFYAKGKLSACSNGSFDLYWAFLKPGRLLMMSRSVPHIVFTTQDSLCFGEHFWDSEDFPDILTEVARDIDFNFFNTNEDQAEQFPDVIRVLEAKFADPEWRQAFKLDEAALLQLRDTCRKIQGPEDSQKKTRSGKA